MPGVLKGAPPARQSTGSGRDSRRMLGTCTDSVNKRDVLRRGGGSMRGLSPQVAGSPARFLLRNGAPSRAAAAAPMPRTSPQHAPRRNAPWIRAPLELPGRSTCVRCANRQMKGPQAPAGTPRIVRAGPSSVQGTRRSFLTTPQRPLRRKHLRDPPWSAGNLCRPCGPGDEGQAGGLPRVRATNLGGSPQINGTEPSTF